ncbi:MAG: hypothetical protein H6741_35865, partial [Alphaproteobacteria bacterium]|nr:hypothetical protein [Alphaproteobacteria bacterium]
MLPLALLACTAPPDDALLFFVPETLEPPMQSFARGLSWDDVRVEVARHPERRTGGGGLQVGLTLDLTCAQCFEVEQVGDDYVVHAGDLLGAQYGAAAVLEAAGFRFHHPMAALAPDSLDTVDPTVVDGLHEPDMQRRG